MSSPNPELKGLGQHNSQALATPRVQLQRRRCVHGNVQPWHTFLGVSREVDTSPIDQDRNGNT